MSDAAVDSNSNYICNQNVVKCRFNKDKVLTIDFEMNTYQRGESGENCCTVAASL